MFDSAYSHFDCKYWLVFYLGILHYFIILLNHIIVRFASLLRYFSNPEIISSRGKAQKFPSYLIKNLLYNKGLLPIPPLCKKKKNPYKLSFSFSFS